MNKYLIRIVAFAIIPSLSLEPALASGLPVLPHAPSILQKNTSLLFTQQAVNPFSVWVGVTAIYRFLTAHNRKDVSMAIPSDLEWLIPGPRRDYAMAGPTQRNPRTDWLGHEVGTDAVIRDAFKQADTIADPAQRTLSVILLTGKDWEVKRAALFLRTTGIEQLEETFMQLADGQLPFPKAKNWSGKPVRPRIYLISVSPDYLKQHPDAKYPLGHASDLGIYLFVPSTEKPAAEILFPRLVHEYFAFLGQPNPISTAFETAASQSEPSPALYMNYAPDSRAQQDFTRRLEEELEEAVVVKTLPLGTTLRAGRTHIRKLLEGPGRRNPNLLLNLTRSMTIGQIYVRIAQKIFKQIQNQTALLTSFLIYQRVFTERMQHGPVNGNLIPPMNRIVSEAFLDETYHGSLLELSRAAIKNILTWVSSRINETSMRRVYRWRETGSSLKVPFIGWDESHAAWVTVKSHVGLVALEFWIGADGQPMYCPYFLRSGPLQLRAPPKPVPESGTLDIAVDLSDGATTPPDEYKALKKPIGIVVRIHDENNQFRLEVTSPKDFSGTQVETIQPMVPDDEIIAQNFSAIMEALSPGSLSSQAWRVHRTLSFFADAQGRLLQDTPGGTRTIALSQVTLAIDDVNQHLSIMSPEDHEYIVINGEIQHEFRRHHLLSYQHGNITTAINRYNAAMAKALSQGRDWASEPGPQEHRRPPFLPEGFQSALVVGFLAFKVIFVTMDYPHAIEIFLREFSSWTPQPGFAIPAIGIFFVGLMRTFFGYQKWRHQRADGLGLGFLLTGPVWIVMGLSLLFSDLIWPYGLALGLALTSPTLARFSPLISASA